MTRADLQSSRPRSFRIARASRLLAASTLVPLVIGCGVDEKVPSPGVPPTTEIVEPRLSGEPAQYDLRVSWKGFDEDGTLAGFEVAVDDSSAWGFTTSFESLFTFESRLCCVTDSVALPGGGTQVDSLAYEPHTLFVRAVDNDGNRDPTPDHITFTSTNFFPETAIYRGPSESTFELTGRTLVLAWRGQDRDGTIASYRYRLDAEPWVTVPGDCTRVRFVNLSTAKAAADTAGIHSFTVFAIDNAGAEERTIDSPSNVRRWKSVATIGPTLTIVSNVMGSRTGRNDSTGYVGQGSPISFDWSADLSLDDGVVQCYEYAYDDTTTWSTCDIRWTHYPTSSPNFSPTIGFHNLIVRAVGDLGERIESDFPFTVLPVEPQRPNVLYVDDFDEGSSGSGSLFPNDGREDAFWDSVLAGYPYSAFDCERNGDIPPVRLVGRASTVVWYLDGSNTRLGISNDPTNLRNPLPAFVNAGGNLILCGSLVSQSFAPDNHFDSTTVTQPGCPHEPRASYFGPERSLDWYPAYCDTRPTFFYDALKVSRSFHDEGEGTNLRRLRSAHPAMLPNLPDLEPDLAKRGNLLDGTPILSLGLEDCDQYLLREIPISDPDVVIPLWTFVDVQGTERRVCGFYVPRSTRTSRGNILVLGFPPYFFKTEEMRAVFHTFLDLFGEECQGPNCSTRAGG